MLVVSCQSPFDFAQGKLVVSWWKKKILFWDFGGRGIYDFTLAILFS
jgi:hypothetical protein